MSTPHIAVVGSANIDLTTFTDDFPRPGETIFGRAFDLGFGGKGANQAVAARLCGAEVSMIARVGDDLFADATLANFASFGIDTTNVRVTRGVSSGVAPIFVDSAGQNRILVVKGANDRLTPEDIDAAEETLERADVIVVQLEVPIQTVYYTLRFARERAIRTILNPAPGQPLDLRAVGYADFVIPNETEAEAISGVAVRDVDTARSCAHRLLENGLRNVIVTLGEKGAFAAIGQSSGHVAGYPVQPVDTSGAGDAFIGSFAYFLADGMEEFDAIHRANLYAALSTLAKGTQKSFPTRARFDAAWASR